MSSPTMTGASTGSASRWGPLWGNRPADWALSEDQQGPTYEAALRHVGLEPATLNLLTDRRRHAPGGANGGEPGACGENLLNDEELPPKAARELAEGDVVTVRTPGGGGYGKAAV